MKKLLINRMWKERMKIFQAELQSSSQPSQNPRMPFASFWVALEPGQLKVSVDLNFLSPSCSGYGIVLRDSTGNVVATSFGKTKASSPIQSEAMALLTGMKILKDFDKVHIKVELDCLPLLQALNSKNFDLALDALFFSKDIDVVAASLSIFLVFVNRLYNRIAQLNKV
ncbi:PREDICTED: uncharacterized protein LOC104590825 [Nelumbo nucifera]|uniref:Uncharacterized protein LOC104590825 n=1 Tax=Nelumbo nucifera TaxID=4432 RepID=A0A1U7Z9X2_NELNU|nr:PREDICTED: uncharacterized protein LOC104590825 [Nelumbo nucifera]